jgi:glutamyl-tRNA synthetase
VRIRTSDEGSTSWDDLVQGTITFPNKDIDDLIILRGDGSPTYLLAVVVDDHDMSVSHVIRGSDHISNTPRQIVIYKGAGWEHPNFGHIPLIHGADGQKLSKRHGATGVEQYEALGYLPEAMRNYLARLSWSHGNDEIFTTEQAIEWFDVKDCNKSPSCFDFDKLKDLNAHYIRQCDPDRLLALVLKLFPEVEPHKEKIAMAVDMLKPRAKTLVEYRWPHEHTHML